MRCMSPAHFQFLLSGLSVWGCLLLVTHFVYGCRHAWKQAVATSCSFSFQRHGTLQFVALMILCPLLSNETRFYLQACGQHHRMQPGPIGLLQFVPALLIGTLQEVFCATTRFKSIDMMCRFFVSCSMILKAMLRTFAMKTPLKLHQETVMETGAKNLFWCLW